MPRHAYEDSSTQQWAAKNLPGLGDRLEQFAQGFDNLSKQASEDQVVPQVVATEFAGAAAQARAAAMKVRNLYRIYTTLMEHDVARAKGERGSTRQEKHADVGYAVRDV